MVAEGVFLILLFKSPAGLLGTLALACTHTQTVKTQGCMCSEWGLGGGVGWGGGFWVQHSANCTDADSDMKLDRLAKLSVMTSTKLA